MERTSYYLRQTWKHLIRSRGTVVQTLWMMTAGMLLLGVFSWSSHQSERVLKSWQGDAPILLFLKDGLPDKEQKSFVRTLKAKNVFQRVELVSPRQASQLLSKHLGRSAMLGVQTFLLPTTIELRLKPSFRSRKRVKTLGERFSKHKFVKQVDYSQEWYKPLRLFTLWIKRGFWVGGLLVLLAIVFLVSGTIRLSLVLRQEEISIMRLVGATEFFLRFPYYLEGLFLGFLSSLLALCFLQGVLRWLSLSYKDYFLSLMGVSLVPLPALESAALCLAGVCAGVLGSRWAFSSRSEKS